jgi:hypothetical protein
MSMRWPSDAPHNWLGVQALEEILSRIRIDVSVSYINVIGTRGFDFNVDSFSLRHSIGSPVSEIL